MGQRSELHLPARGEGTLQYGSAFKNERRKPFDRFDTSVQLNYGEKTRVGQLTIRGDLASWKLGSDEENPKHVFAITQDFDYVDNEAYEYGGSSSGDRSSRASAPWGGRGSSPG